MSRFNYVYLPIEVGGVSGLHITLKFLNDLDIPPEVVAKRLAALIRFTPSIHAWSPELFGAEGAQARVLEVIRCDGLLHSLHSVLRDLRDEDFPTYRPHITINDSGLWTRLTLDKLAVGDISIMIGQPHYAYMGKRINLMKLIKEYKNV